MILPLVIFDVHKKSRKNPNYTLSIKRLNDWEENHEQIPAGVFMAMRTDWSKRWPDTAKMKNIIRSNSLPNLDQVPEFGDIVVVSFPKPKGGSGFPARVFAIVP